MTISIPVWLLWTLGIALGIVILALAAIGFLVIRFALRGGFKLNW